MDEVGACANLQERFTNLIGAVDFLAMNLSEAEALVRLHLRFEIALHDGDSNVIHELYAGNGGKIFMHGLPADGLALILLVEPFLERREVVEHRGGVHLAATGERPHGVLPGAALPH